MIQSRLFLLRDNDFIHGALSDLNCAWMFLFSCVTYCMKDHFQKSIIGALMLIQSWPKALHREWSFFGAQCYRSFLSMMLLCCSRQRKYNVGSRAWSWEVHPCWSSVRGRLFWRTGTCTATRWHWTLHSLLPVSGLRLQTCQSQETGTADPDDPGHMRDCSSFVSQCIQGSAPVKFLLFLIRPFIIISSRKVNSS